MFLFLGFFALFGAVQNAGYFDASDSESRFALLESIVKGEGLKARLPWEKEATYQRYSIGPVLPAAPFYIAARILYRHAGTKADSSPSAAKSPPGWNIPERLFFNRAMLISSAFYSAVLIVALYALLLHIGRNNAAAVALAIVCGISTLVFPYAKSFQTENLVGLCLVLTVLHLLRFGARGMLRNAVIAGLVFGFALTIKTELLILVPVWLATLWLMVRQTPVTSRRITLIGVAAFLGSIYPGLIVVAWYNVQRYGSLLSTGYEDYGFTYAWGRGLFLQMVSPGKGLLWYSPVIISALYYIPRFARWKSAESIALLGAPAVMVVVYSCWFSPTGDTSLGPRFLVSYLPLLMAPLLVPLVRQRTRAGRSALALLALTGVAIQVVHVATSYLYFFHTRFFSVPVAEQEHMLERMRFMPQDSMFLGNFHTFAMGLLDMHLVRFNPLERQLYFLPLFWGLMAVATLGVGVALLRGDLLDQRARVTSHRHPGVLSVRGTALVLIPAVAFALFAYFRVGELRDGLKVIYRKDGMDQYHTVAADVAYQDVRMDRIGAIILRMEPFDLHWTGSFYAPQTGAYLFRPKATGGFTLQIDQEAVASMPSIPGEQVAEREVYLTEGWHSISFLYHYVGGEGRARIKWQPPGGSMQAFSKARFRQDATPAQSGINPGIETPRPKVSEATTAPATR